MIKCLFRSLVMIGSLLVGAADTDSPSHPRIRYEHLGVEDGLSQGSVRALALDQQGFLWLGTHDGLNRYDGRTMVRYYHEAQNPHSLPANAIMRLLASPDGGLWIITVPYLAYYDPHRDAFQTFKHDPADPGSIADGDVNDCSLDRQQRLWVTIGSSVSRLQDDGSFRNYVLGDGKALVSDVVEDLHGTVWAITNQGIYFYKPDKDLFSPMPEIDFLGSCYRAFVDRDENLWVGGDDGAIMRYAAAGIRQKTYTAELMRPRQSLDFGISQIYQDRDGLLYFGFHNRGYAVLAPGSKDFQYRRDEGGRQNSLGNDIVFSFVEDTSGNMWLGTGGSGVSIIKKYGLPFEPQRPVPHNPGAAGNFITDVIVDHKNNLFLLSQRNGFYYWDRQTDTYQNFAVQKTQGLLDNSLLCGALDDKGILWLGSEGGTLSRFDTVTWQFLDGIDLRNDWYGPVGMVRFDDYGRLWVRHMGLLEIDPITLQRKRHFEADKGEISSHQVFNILSEGPDKLWVATLNGALELIDLERNSITHYWNDGKPLRVRALYKDQQGRFWVGSDQGLGRFYPETGRFDFFSQSIGFANHTTYAIEEDERGSLWVSTNLGLTRYDPQTGEVQNFFTSDGLQGSEFNTGASAKTTFGELAFGGTQGFNLFTPARLRANPYRPKVVLTKLTSFGKEIEQPVSVTMADRIVLSHLQNTFTLSFAGLEYTRPERNTYAYQLMPYDNDWHMVGTQGHASYTKVPPGQYTFRVKAANGDGKWSEDIKDIRLVIVPPYWLTWWFRILVAIGLFVVMLWVYRLRMKQRLAREALVGELRTARQMQAGLMPHVAPEVDGLDVAGVCIASEHVGGDFYDYLPMKDGSFGVALVDVNTRAMEGAMTTIMTSGLMHAEVLDHSSPAEILTRMNRATWRKTNKRTFVAMALASYDNAQRIMRFSNAGLPALMLYRDGVFQYLRPEGMRMPLGVLENTRYEERSIAVLPGDRMVWFTDGITEAMDRQRKEFGEKGMEQVIAALPPDASSKDMVTALLAAVREHVKEPRFEDDVTVVGLRVL